MGVLGGMELIGLGFEPYLLYGGIGLVLTLVIFFSSPGGMIASLMKPAATIGLLIVWALVLAPIIAMQRRSIEVDGHELVIRSTFYTSRTQLSDIRAIYEYAPGAGGVKFGTRTNGIGVPGLSSGWFSSKGNQYFVDAVEGANIAIYFLKNKYVVALQVKAPLKMKDLLLDLAAAEEKAARAEPVKTKSDDEKAADEAAEKARRIAEDQGLVAEEIMAPESGAEKSE
ncbi:MAG: hypothetical protein Q4D91_10495 [Lautropia sp.]|nr:hypothetical protein [Lautropia sp.]